MKDNIALRLFGRSLLHLIVSIALVIIVVGALILFSEFFLSVLGVLGIRTAVRNMVRGFGESYVIYGISIVLFILFFSWMQWRLFGYFNKMNKTVKDMAEGRLHLDHKMEVRSSNPFGDMAGNVNRLAGRLHLALEEERRAEQTKNELITNVSHDLRTPLTSVLGYLGLIEQDRYRDEVELRHYVQIAYDKSQRLNVLINDLFEYTKMRNDTNALKQTNFNIVEMLGQLLVQYHLPLQDAGMQSKLVARETLITVQGDAAKLVRVFENLIANAMAYGREGKRVVLAVNKEGNEVVVEVINYGEPIPAIDLPHIFDRFYRVDRSRTQWTGGSGLGLAISKSIVEMHGGTISVSSDQNETSFRVSLPIVN
ncbi:sensor histidine kinase [Paenibacillus castaneae]|uniref:sensor histidine kinase n=1 Tax=Paenibacillus castaneae TaxID=474957 RepID=UPI000C9C836C|nr:ATP-binding protein [Paenibacillus castaneae]